MDNAPNFELTPELLELRLAVNNDRWIKFAEFKTTGMTNYKAAQLAGYSKKSAADAATRISKNDDVKRYMQALCKPVEVIEGTILEREGRLATLSKAALICFGKAPVIDEATGKPGNSFKFDPRTGKELIAELNKMTGEYAPDKLLIDARVEFNINY